jgi:putative PIN family toxin of toxin-antitoxin system
MPESPRKLKPKPATKVVLDTNILVSSLIVENGNCATILKLVMKRKILVFYNAEILDEYRRVLNYPILSFEPHRIGTHLNLILRKGFVMNPKKSTIKMTDESDRVFYDLHKTTGAILITGNARHYPPNEKSIMNPADFLAKQMGLKFSVKRKNH